MYKYDEERNVNVLEIGKPKTKEEKTGLQLEIQMYVCGLITIGLVSILAKIGLGFISLIGVIPLIYGLFMFKKNVIIEIHPSLKNGKKEKKSLFEIPFGVDEAGQVFYCDIRKLPHLLIGGASGYGKSTLFHRLILSLARINPKRLRFIMIDTKNELMFYEDLPHLLTENILDDLENIERTLMTLVIEMDSRYKIFKSKKVRSIESFNKISEKKMQYIFIFIDELADIILSADKRQKSSIENALARLGGKARACGIHLIIGTQRPSSDVITGLIKANFPNTLAFKTATSGNSEIILDQKGAEEITEKGKFIFKTNDGLKYLKGFNISEDEIVENIKMICDRYKVFLPKINYKPEIKEEIIKPKKILEKKKIFKNDLTEKILRESIVENESKISSKFIRDSFGIGADNSKKIIDELEELNFISEMVAINKPRKVLITLDELDDFILRKAI